MTPVRFARAFRWSILVTALTGCLVAPGAMAQGQNDLDYMTYGQPSAYAAPQPASNGGGAIAALRRALAGASRPAYYAQPPAYASAPAYTPAPAATSTPYNAYAAAPPAAPVVMQAPAPAPASGPDATAYGQPYRAPAPVADASGGGAISALRNAVATSRAAPVVMQAPAPVVYGAYAAAPMPVRYDAGYRLDAGDKLRVVVYGQEGLTNTYTIDASGSITMPLIGQVAARGRSPASLAAEISAKLRNGYIREPSVAVEIDSYRPFFILGEVQAPGQYPYVPNMTVESAIAIAGGFSPRAKRDFVTLTHTDANGVVRYVVPLGTAMGPGDTIQVAERWF